jgi:hypothetical protein
VTLPIVQAPFRIYYAYNINRLHSQIVAKNPYINPDEIKFLQNSLDPLVWKFEVLPELLQIQNNPGRLDYFEPKTTFRFTVGKTF